MMTGDKFLSIEDKLLRVMETTGPFMVTRMYESFPDKSEITLLPANLIAPLTKSEVEAIVNGNQTVEIENKVEKAYAVHYFFGSWISKTLSEEKN